MKGRMDILNLKKRFSPEVEFRGFDAGNDDGVKIEPDLEREYSEDVSDLSDASSNDNEIRLAEDLRVVKNELEEEDEEEVSLEDIRKHRTIASVITQDNKEGGVLIPHEVEIKYEDDIEEEDYDSDGDTESVDPSEMPELTSLHDDKSNSTGSGINFGQNDRDIMQAEDLTRRPCFNSSYFEPSMLNFQMSEHMLNGGGTLSNGNDMSGSLLNGNGDKAGDSVLLSIVYATINVPFSQVSKFLTAYNLSKSQLCVIRKVRRQVKNRLYAQNCRRRRVAHIRNLANELKQIKTEKEKLLSQRGDLMAKRMSLQTRYKQLFNHVMRSLSAKYKNQSLQLTDSNMNHSDEPEARMQKRKLFEEHEQMISKKCKLMGKYEELRKHIYNVITARHHNNTMSKDMLQNNIIDFKLCNMNIVNELAILNKYYSKNNDGADVESSVSVDGSRTSESKLNDFVDYDSSVSVDGSRSEENTLNDFIDYESSQDGSETNALNFAALKKHASGHDQEQVMENTRMVEKNEKFSDDSAAAWTDNSEDEEESDDEMEILLDELEDEQNELAARKRSIEEKYDLLYNHVLQTLQNDETNFLKMYTEHCLRLLRKSVSDSCSAAFDGS